MARAASFLRGIITAVITLLLLPLVSRIWGGVLDRADVANHPLDWFMTGLAAATQLPGFFPALYVTVGLFAGVWMDWVLRRFDGGRHRRLVDLGVNIRSLGRVVRDRQNGFHNEWPTNISDLKPSLLSARIKLAKYGIWSPGEAPMARTDGAKILIEYLETVGMLLREGQFSDAKEKANQVKADLNAPRA